MIILKVIVHILTLGPHVQLTFDFVLYIAYPERVLFLISIVISSSPCTTLNREVS